MSRCLSGKFVISVWESLAGCGCQERVLLARIRVGWCAGFVGFLFSFVLGLLFFLWEGLNYLFISTVFLFLLFSPIDFFLFWTSFFCFLCFFISFYFVA